MSTEKQRIRIVGSGNQFELIGQLFDWGRDFRQRKLFKLVLENTSTGDRITVYTHIRGINEHHGSDTAFNINGIVSTRVMEPSALLLWEKQDSWLNDLEKFDAHLDTRTREGTIWKKKF